MRAFCRSLAARSNSTEIKRLPPVSIFNFILFADSPTSIFNPNRTYANVSRYSFSMLPVDFLYFFYQVKFDAISLIFIPNNIIIEYQGTGAAVTRLAIPDLRQKIPRGLCPQRLNILVSVVPYNFYVEIGNNWITVDILNYMDKYFKTKINFLTNNWSDIKNKNYIIL